MRVSCGIPRQNATSAFMSEIEKLHLQPIITNVIVRVVYEGPDKKLGESIVRLFSNIEGHDVTVFYDEEEQRKSSRKAERKAERARKNAKLHGH